MSTRAFRSQPTESRPFYPRLLGRNGAVASEHYLSANAGADILKAGGNAVDAASAAVLVEGLVNPQMNSIGGECPILIYLADTNDVVAINGNTMAPAAATAEAYRARGFVEMPDEGILAAGVPATPGALLTALMRYGTLPLAEVAAPAITLAREGWPLHCGLVGQEKFGIKALADKFRRDWPDSAALYLKDGAAPEEGDISRNLALADMLDHMVRAEAGAGGDRVAGLRAAYRSFYAGEIAEEITRFSKSRDGFLARNDMEHHKTFIEAPFSIDFADTTLFKCGFWTQGPTVLQTLAILSCFDTASLGHNSADYLHLVIEATKLVYADREQYYGDPRVVDVPQAGLLSPNYAALRSKLIDFRRVEAALRPGDPRAGKALLSPEEWLGSKSWGPGTVHVDVIDRHGNMVAATPSGAWIKANEVIAKLGFPLGNRLMTFYLEPDRHPNLVAPHKRPRTTISPSIAFRDGKPWMAFGTMGGDQQDQWQLQFFLNRALFGMSLQQAIEAPKFSSEHFPGFFAPHDRFPNRVRIEPRVGEDVLAALEARGHEVEVAADWTEGYMLAAAQDPGTGVLEAGTDPRGAKGEVFQPFALCW